MIKLLISKWRLSVMSYKMKGEINNDCSFQGPHPPAKPSNIGNKDRSRTPNKITDDKKNKRGNRQGY
jgi:hypothetical protein